jgi:multiple sugar transport system permease protein
MARRTTLRFLGKIFWYGLVVLILAPAIFVFFWMVTSSLKHQVEIYALPPIWLNFQATLRNYKVAFSTTPFVRFALNSTIVALGSSIAGLVIGLPAAYSIARYRQGRLGMILLTARLMPGVGYLVPLFILFLKLKLIGTYPALILSHLVVTFPLTVYIMVGFFEDLPSELLDAALIDGCSKFGSFFRIALPLTRPGMVTAAILAFIFSWNDFKMALILSNSSTRTLPVAVFNFVHEASLDWGAMMAYSTIITIPVLVLALFIQRHIVTGLTMGGIK